MDAVAKEQWALALLTARFDCAQQRFFQAEYGRRRRSPAVALALCLTLGAFGAHEFYLGRLRSAALRLLFCWTLIPLLLALLEASFLSRRVRACNARMARALAEIVDETFAAAREQPAPAWQAGAARTLAPQQVIRWRQDAPSTTPLAEERLASDAPETQPDATTTATPSAEIAAIVPPPSPALPAAAPSALPDRVVDSQDYTALAPLSEPVFAYSGVISRRERARLGPSLDALLADPALLADDAEAPWISATASAAALTAPSIPIASIADTPPPADDYAKMMATDEPPAAIMGAGPVSVVVAAPVTAPRIQRIIVRKVALVDGHAIAEARAIRDVVISGPDDEVEAHIASATDEARDEAMRLLATLVPSETLALAHGA